MIKRFERQVPAEGKTSLEIAIVEDNEPFVKLLLAHT